MNDEKLMEIFRESRLISAADNVLFPWIKLEIENRLNLACSRFVGGEKEFIADIAFIHGLKKLEHRLRQLQTAGNKANADLNKDLLK